MPIIKPINDLPEPQSGQPSAFVVIYLTGDSFWFIFAKHESVKGLKYHFAAQTVYIQAFICLWIEEAHLKGII